jgi:hypothetical protein|tara:strand:- start:913 stop:1131 length:219 start_codon:yes stop_codon:yes gene_type:complete
MQTTKQKMINLISKGYSNLDDIMFNCYDIFTDKLSDQDLRELADLHFTMTGDLDMANMLYLELDHFNNQLIG